VCEWLFTSTHSLVFGKFVQLLGWINVDGRHAILLSIMDGGMVE
jgi:hypothetical protein